MAGPNKNPRDNPARSRLWNRTSRGPIVVVDAIVKFGNTVVIPLRLLAVIRNQDFDLCYAQRDFALLSNEISTFLHRRNSPPENSFKKCDPHAG